MKEKPLTVKQKRFLQIKIKNPSISNRKAVIQAGYSPNTSQSGKVAKVVRRKIEEALEKAGLTEEYLTKRMFEGTNAYEKTYLMDRAGNVTTMTDIDFAARLKYIELISKIRGDIIDKVRHSGEIGLRPIKDLINEGEDDG